jgi:hypothetical protein
MKKEVILLLSIACLILSLSGVYALRINEVMYSPENNTGSANEWVEVYFNESTDIKSWKISVNERNDGIYNCSNINSEILLSNQTYLLITNNQTDNLNELNCSSCLKVCTFKSRFGSYGLSNVGAIITLFDENNNTRDFFNYTNYTTLANGNKKSLQFSNNTWLEADPTPGYNNYFTPTNQTAEKSILLYYSQNVSYGEVFNFNLTLMNFPSDIYNVKIDVNNISSNNQSLSQIWNGTKWQTTDWYVYNAINTLFFNSSLFLLNITKEYNGTANINITIKDSSEEKFFFSGFLINIFYTQTSQIQTTPQTAQTTQNQTKPELIIEDYSDIGEGGEGNVEISFLNLADKDYDVKISILDSNNKIISEVYDKNLDKWQSSNYYLKKAVSGSEKKDFELRLKNNRSYSGDAEIEVKLRENGKSTILSSEKEEIEINGKGNETTISSEYSNSINFLTGESIINPEIQKVNEGKVYESKTEKILKFTPYLLGVVFILIILLILVKI